MKRSPKKRLKLRAWKLFSEYIRRRDSDKEGYVRCVTCNSLKHYSKQQAGHFIPGRNLSILFEQDCVHPQCRGCNLYGGGKAKEYFLFMRDRYGLKRIEELYVQANTTRKYTESDYEKLIEDLKIKLHILDHR